MSAGGMLCHVTASKIIKYNRLVSQLDLLTIALDCIKDYQI